ncbi:hypothetical protein EYF80_015754 [Liparis tanakae]|uniref:Uncharacterized protein n=1 Tax=Liparis tanakae TaxID=230148 RepID=A0A4Z2IAE7_9TELE|nr:hypothetical protein EYF80_015754 [Liparis tanakae]
MPPVWDAIEHAMKALDKTAELEVKYINSFKACHLASSSPAICLAHSLQLASSPLFPSRLATSLIPAAAVIVPGRSKVLVPVVIVVAAGPQ